MTPMLDVRNLEQEFAIGGGLFDRLRFERGRVLAPRKIVHAVNGVSFTIARGEVLALVGESGCGKSTVAKTIARIYRPTSGEIRIDGKDVAILGHREMLPVRARMQMIFQDPFASLNPRQKVRDIVAEPLLEQTAGRAARAEVTDRTLALLARVGLNAEHAGRYPHQFSGGQRQRIGIARALSVNPALIIADEPVSALDVSIQAQILNLMMDLKDELRAGLSVHQPRPVGGASHRRPGGGDVSGLHGRERAARCAVCNPPPPLYAGLAVRRADDPGKARRCRDRAFGRGAKRSEPAVGLLLPHPLPLCLGPLHRRAPHVAGRGR